MLVLIAAGEECNYCGCYLCRSVYIRRAFAWALLVDITPPWLNLLAHSQTLAARAPRCARFLPFSASHCSWISQRASRHRLTSAQNLKT